jgi:prepilin-type N-terminal cleavage/methylation domain-containing protein
LGGFSLVEVLIGSAIVGIFFLSFFAMTGTGFNMVKSSRENLRATQIILNRMEGVRLFNWDQLSDTSKLPATFVENYDPTSTNGNFGTVYNGTMTVTTPTMNPAATYSTNGVKQVTVTLSWNSGGMNHTRTMSTYISRYGAQNYVFAN